MADSTRDSASTAVIGAATAMGRIIAVVIATDIAAILAAITDMEIAVIAAMATAVAVMDIEATMATAAATRQEDVLAAMAGARADSQGEQVVDSAADAAVADIAEQRFAARRTNSKLDACRRVKELHRAHLRSWALGLSRGCGCKFSVQRSEREKENSARLSRTNESAVRGLLEQWAAAVRAKNMPEVLANHSPDIRMFDVPPPFESRGLAAYGNTWELFYSSQPVPVAFDIKWLEVVAGDDVAFAFAHMQCVESAEGVLRTALDFRLTVGLRKVDGRWMIVHEHHSVPATT